jgi:hypothetical protein
MVKYAFCLVASIGLTACGGQGGASSVQANAGAAMAQSDGKQYRAVCLEEKAHGSIYVLSRWLDSKDKAFELGNYHGDFKEKGHRWKLEEREKPKTVTP